MKKSTYLWKIDEPEPLSDDFLKLLENERVHPLIGQLLWKRGIQTKEMLEIFLKPTIEHLYDPFLLYGMEKVVSRIQEAIEKNEKILIYGDYDADGITSTTVMKEAIELIGGEVSYFLPNRFKHGYGPNVAVFEEQIQQGIELIITVDNGVAGHEAIQIAKQQGVDVIVTDHHELPDELPEAYAIIHPKHPKGTYPFKELAGVGVAFKVATALLGEVPMELLDLVAIGTIADLVSLTDENRVLTKIGLEMLRVSERIGLDLLYHQAEIKKESINEEIIGFSVAPRLNAIGRLGEASPGVDLLTTFDEEKAEKIAVFINNQNDERKAIVSAIEEEAFALLNEEDVIHVVAKKGWHEGVLGIVAGRIMKATGKPTVVLTIDEKTQVAKGSGRSVSALNLFDALSQSSDLLTFFGGHHMAAGMTLPDENIDSLKKSLVTYIQTNHLDLLQGQELLIDETLQVEEVTIPFIQQLNVLAPYGIDNLMPVFLFKEVVAEQLKQIGSDRSHLKFQMKKKQVMLDAIAFQMGSDIDEFGSQSINITGQLSINEWNGHKKPQVMVDDFAVDGLQVFDMRGKNGHQKKIASLKTIAIRFAKVKQQQTNVLEDYYYDGNEEELLKLMSEQAIEQIVFLDCPSDQKIVKKIVGISGCNRIYLMFDTKEEAYLNGVGSKEQFAKLYKFIHQQEKVDVRYKLDVVANYLKLPKSLLVYMIQVFLDLGFVKVEQGIMEKIENPISKPLIKSAIYQQRLQQIKVEEFLLYSDCETIRRWLLTEEDTEK